MKKLVSAVLVFALSVFPIGCGVSGSVDINNDNGETNIDVKIKIHKHKPIQDGTKSDVVSYAGQSNVDLTDVPAGFTINPASTPQAVVTITTDTGLTFAQTFNLVQVDASPYASGPAGTTTYAFAAQSPDSVTSFVQSAASQANSTVTSDTQTYVGLVAPKDGNTYTLSGRNYNTTTGAQFIGSASYTTPVSGGTRCTTRICPNQ